MKLCIYYKTVIYAIETIEIYYQPHWWESKYFLISALSLVIVEVPRSILLSMGRLLHSLGPNVITLFLNKVVRNVGHIKLISLFLVWETLLVNLNISFDQSF